MAAAASSVDSLENNVDSREWISTTIENKRITRPDRWWQRLMKCMGCGEEALQDPPRSSSDDSRKSQKKYVKDLCAPA